MRKEWTAEEERLLINLYPETLAEDLAKKMGRSLHSIYHKAKKLGLKKSPSFQSKIIQVRAIKIAKARGWLWTEKEIRFLKENWQLPVSELAKKLGRSEIAVTRRLWSLRLLKVRKWTRKEDTILTKLYATKKDEEIARKIGRTKSAIQQRARKLGLVKNLEVMEEIRHEAAMKGAEKRGWNWTEEDDEKLVSLFKQGKTVKEISKELDRTLSSVRYRLGKYNLKYGNTRYTSGITGEKLAESIFKQMGWKIIKRGGKNLAYDYIVLINEQKTAIDVKHNVITESFSKLKRLEQISQKAAIVVVKGNEAFLLELSRIC